MNQQYKTYRATILDILKNPRTQITCGEICKRLIKRLDIESWKHQYLSGGVSSILHKLVNQGLLTYADIRGPRGGYVYRKQLPGVKVSLKDIEKKRDKRFEEMKLKFKV